MTTYVDAVKKPSSFLSVLRILLVLVSFVFLAAMVWSMSHSTDPLDDDLAYLPDGANVITHFNVPGFLQSDFWREAQPWIEEQLRDEPQGSFRMDSVVDGMLLQSVVAMWHGDAAHLSNEWTQALLPYVETVAMGEIVPQSIESSEFERDQPLAGVIRLSADLDFGDLTRTALNAEPVQEQTDGGNLIFVVGHYEFCQISPRVIAFGHPATLRDVLRRNGRPATLAPELSDKLLALDCSRALSMVGARRPCPSGEIPGQGLYVDVIESMSLQGDADSALHISAEFVMRTEVDDEVCVNIIHLFGQQATRYCPPNAQAGEGLHQLSRRGTSVTLELNMPPSLFRDQVEGTRRLEAEKREAVCAKNIGWLQRFIKDYEQDLGKYPADLDELARHHHQRFSRRVPRWCLTHDAIYEVDPKTGDVSELARQSLKPRAAANKLQTLEVKDIDEARSIVTGTLSSLGDDGEYLLFSEAETGDQYTFALLLPPLYLDRACSVTVFRSGPQPLPVAYLEEVAGVRDWDGHAGDLLGDFEPRLKTTITESYSTPQELFAAFKASAIEGDYERYVQTLAGEAKENRASRSKMHEAAQSFSLTEYKGFEPMLPRVSSWLKSADGRQGIRKGDFEFGYLRIEREDSNRSLRVKAAKLVDGWRLLED